jgi:O-antigen/teichoic acid export membrane protein
VSKQIDPPSITTGEQGAEAIAETHFAAPPEHGRSATRAVKSNLRASLIIQLLNIVSGVELARGLGLTGRGELAAAMLWPTVIGALATLGLEESMTYHVARGREKVGRLLGSALGLCTVQGLIFTALTMAIVPLALQRHDSQTIVAGLIYSLYVALNCYGLALAGTLNGLHRYSWYNWVRLSVGILLVTAQTILLILGLFTVGVIVTAFIGCYVASGLFVAWLVRRAKPGPLHADVATARMIFSYGVKSNAGTTSSFLNQRLDQLVISVFLSATQLGLYVVAVTFTLFTPLIGASIAVAGLPNLASLDARHERILLARRLVSVTLAASIVLSLPIIILAPLLIKLFFGSAFAAGADITRIVAVASIALSTNRSLEAVLRGVGRPLAAGVAELVALGATVVGLAVLLPTLGLIGAAWASLLAYFVSGAWMVMRIRSILDVPVGRILTPDREGLKLLAERARGLRARLADRS